MSEEKELALSDVCLLIVISICYGVALLIYPY